MVNGKQKGGQFERDCCVALSKWVSGGLNKDLYWRSAMSGGRATVARGQVRQAGDICAVAPEAHILTDHLYFECKFLKHITLDSLIKGNGELLSIWKHVEEDAARYNRMPVLIFRQNRYPTVLCATGMGIEFLQIRDAVLLSSRGMHFVRFDDMLKLPFSPGAFIHPAPEKRVRILP